MEHHKTINRQMIKGNKSKVLITTTWVTGRKYERMSWCPQYPVAKWVLVQRERMPADASVLVAKEYSKLKKWIIQTKFYIPIACKAMSMIYLNDNLMAMAGQLNLMPKVISDKCTQICEHLLNLHILHMNYYKVILEL